MLPGERDMKDALDAVGCATYRELTQQPRAVRDRFHADWTARMHARCGIDPLAVPSMRNLDTFRRKAMGREGVDRKAVAEAYAEKVPLLHIAERFGVSERTVFRIARAEGLAPHVRSTRDKVADLHATGMVDHEIAAAIGVTTQRVTQLRHLLGLPAHGTRPEVKEVTREKHRAAALAQHARRRAAA